MVVKHSTSRSGKADVGLAKQGLEQLTEDLNKQGKKLLELKATLYKEASITQSEFDMCTFAPLVIKYHNDIGMADAMRASLSDSTFELDSLTSRKQRYHYYEEQLRTSFVLTESLSFFGVQDRFPDDTKFKENVNGCAVATEPEEITHAGVDTVDVAGIGNGKTDAPNIHEKIDQEGSGTANNMQRKQKNGACGDKKEKKKDDIKISKLFATSDNDEDALFDNADVSDTEKYKVLRKNFRCRKPVCQDHFSDPFPPILPNFQSTPSSFTVKQIPSEGQWDSISKRELESPEPVQEDSRWKNKSKSANESWYEFKERCSVTSLSEHMVKDEPLKAPSPFYLKDYMKTPSAVPASQSIKSVRFSLSPSQRACSSKTNAEIFSDSSDDDEVGFVKQFPCIEKPDRTSGKARRQLNFYY